MRRAVMCVAYFVVAITAAHAEDSTFSLGGCTGEKGAPWKQQIEICSALIQSGRGSDVERALAFKNRGNAYSEIDDGDKALADYTEAVRLDPKSAAAYIGRGDVYIDREDPDRAIADYASAIQIDPKNVAAYGHRTLAYSQKGDFDHAIADASEAVRLDPKSAAAFLSRADAYRFKGDFDRAIADYDEALTLDPMHKLHDILVNRGLAYASKGDREHAVADYSEAIRLNPTDPDPLFNRGRLYIYSDAISMAISDFTKTAELEPRYAYAALWLDIADARSKAPSSLSEGAAKLDMARWPAPIVRLFLGQTTPAEVLAAAADPNAAIQIGQVCETNFYSGEWALRQGKKDAAVPLFENAARDCPKTFIERGASIAELKALGAAIP
jgi:tetratricopeptide (TPR) repeat protein